MVKHLLLIILSCSLILNSRAQTDQINTAQAIQNIVEQSVNEDDPGAALGIVKDGEILHEFYFGKANLDHHIDVDENTRFNIASNCKQFTALCILKLMEEGRLKLEEDFRTYIPGMLENIEQTITINHLISHTSGIRDVYGLYALHGQSWWKLFIDNDDAIDMLKSQKDLNFLPGEQFLYSNSNYLILAEIVEVITEERFSDYAKAMFQDLGMESTEFLRYYSLIVPNKAKAYGDWGSGWRECPAVASVHGDGSLYTTLHDQLIWEQTIQQNNGSKLSKDLINLSQSNIYENHGFGTVSGIDRGVDYIYHNGATCAYNANFLRLPEEGISIVVMSNGARATAEYISWQVAELLVDFEENEVIEYPAKPAAIERLRNKESVVGTYQHEDGTIIRITLKNDTLSREMYQRDPIALISEKGGLFEYSTITDLMLNFENIGASNQQFTIYKATQAPSTYHKIPDVEESNYNLAEVVGEYYNDETDTQIIIKHIEEDLFAITKNGKEREAVMMSPDRFRMNNYVITTTRNDRNEVTGLLATKERIVNVTFKKLSQ
ncbi:MAG: beta-lactamase family protein [Flavobacteriales bacterium]|nr:beta-lactamase family protein [Flavobacteriales bacterium]